MGLRIALDDFGTGCSSLTHLRDFKVDRIKIDRSFVGSMEDDGGARAVVQAVTTVAGALSLKTVAEGVETAAQLALLNQLGCDAAQGYLLGRPADSGQTARVIQRKLPVATPSARPLRPRVQRFHGAPRHPSAAAFR